MDPSRLLVARITAAIAVLVAQFPWVISQVYPPAMVLHFLDGPLAALYCGILLGLRSDLRARLVAIVLLPVGLLHAFWLLAGAGVISSVLTKLGVSVPDWIIMCSMTAIPFTILIGAGTRSCLSASVVLLGGVAACIVPHLVIGRTIVYNDPLSLGIGLLHAANIAALALANERAGRSQNTSLCRYCRYNLTGNTTGVCPECGWPIDGPPLATRSHNGS